jgi:hypothetical protein
VGFVNNKITGPRLSIPSANQQRTNLGCGGSVKTFRSFDENAVSFRYQALI